MKEASITVALHGVRLQALSYDVGADNAQRTKAALRDEERPSGRVGLDVNQKVTCDQSYFSTLLTSSLQ